MDEIICKYCGRKFCSRWAYYAHKCEGILEERKLKIQQSEENLLFECPGCGRKFCSNRSLISHKGHCDKIDPQSKKKKSSKYKISDDLYRCECGKEFNNHQSLNAHLSHCDIHHQSNGTERKLRPHELNHTMSGWEHKSNTDIMSYHNKAGKTLSKRIKEGKVIPSFKDKKHSEKSKEKIRISTIYYLEKHGGCRARYNHNACIYIDELNKLNGWNLQHAENGGEIFKCGYFLDGYDEKLNIVFEYDERTHYKNWRKNILKKEDIQRQQYIISQLNCMFFRYNEQLDLFYRVN